MAGVTIAFTPGIVYGNLVKMMTYRGAELNHPPLEHTALTQRLNNRDYVLITGTRGKADPRGEALLVFALVAPGSQIAEKSGAFQGLLNDLPKPPPSGKLEVVVVTEKQLTSFIAKKIVEYLSTRPTVELEVHTYGIWSCEIPKHQLVPKHTIPAPGEFEAHCELHVAQPGSFALIRQLEPMATWLGLKVGMPVRIERVSETAGTSITYRICVPGR